MAHIGGGHRMRGRTGGMGRPRRSPPSPSSPRLVVAVGVQSPSPVRVRPEGRAAKSRVRSGTPHNPLIPGNSQEQNGNNILDAITAKLVYYNTDTAAPQLDIAQSIETER